jgi:HEAT repeat protein
MDGGKVKSADGAITKAMSDPAEQVRASAMASIAVVAKRRGAVPPALVAALTKSLASPAWGDRRVAALAMGNLGTGADTASLAKAATDNSSFVREAVATAIGMLASPNLVDPLLALSKDDVVQVRAAAAKALAKYKDERSQKRRAELAKDPEASVRDAAQSRD